MFHHHLGAILFGRCAYGYLDETNNVVPFSKRGTESAYSPHKKEPNFATTSCSTHQHTSLVKRLACLVAQDPRTLHPRELGSTLSTAIAAVVVEKFLLPETDVGGDAQAPLELPLIVAVAALVPACAGADAEGESVGA